MAACEVQWEYSDTKNSPHQNLSFIHPIKETEILILFTPLREDYKNSN